MFKLICVTDRRLCRGDIIARVGEIAACRPDMIILREKDLSGYEYKVLAERALRACEGSGAELVLHSFVGAAELLGVGRIHLPLHRLREMNEETKRGFEVIGASVHSPAEAEEARRLGASYVVAGHIFDTACKKGLAGRGLGFLREVCAAADIPVYAIGGIGADNISAVASAGAAGACIMSGFMTCGDVSAYMAALREEMQHEI